MNSLSAIKNNFTYFSWGSRWAVFALVGLTGFAFSTAFYFYYYPAFFHSDSASIQVLAQAMVDEMSLLPHDFFYGNQLILFRANLFIAPALKLGLTGYSAYAAGSVINFSVFFLITFLTLETVFRNWVKSLLLTSLYFLPFGVHEADYVFGQQSHLANVVFTLMIAVHSYRACWHKEWRGLVIASSVVFLMSLEAPMRVLFVLFPLTLVIAATGRAKSAVKLSLALVIAFVVGYVGNRYLVTTHSVAVDLSDLAFSTSDRFLMRIGTILKDFVDNYIGFSQFVGMKTSTRINLVLYGVKTLVFVSFVGVFWWLAHRLGKRGVKSWLGNGGTTQCELEALEFIGLLGVTGVLTGFWIISAVEYTDDQLLRHSEGMLQLCKLALCAYSLRVLAYLLPQRLPGYGMLFVVALLSSTPATSFLFAPYRVQLQHKIESNMNLPLNSKIQKLMFVHGINRIYGGNFWRTLRLEVLIPSAKATVLGVGEGSVHYFKWLTRPSMRCFAGEVFYLIDPSKADEEYIARKVLERGGRLLEHIGDTDLYLGAPVWDRSECAG